MQAGKNPKPRKIQKETKTFNYQIEEYISLPPIQNVTDPSFFTVLNKRKSERIFNPLSLQQISNLLWHSLKVKKIILSEGDKILSHRASPSAGAIHPVDVFISLPTKFEFLNLYYYNPYIHKLATLKFNKSELKIFFKNINKSLPLEKATVIWFAAQPERTAIKYKNYDSLIWRDAGALTMTVQLVATALNINSCPIGTLGQPFLSKSFGKKLISGGGLLLG